MDRIEGVIAAHKVHGLQVDRLSVCNPVSRSLDNSDPLQSGKHLLCMHSGTFKISECDGDMPDQDVEGGKGCVGHQEKEYDGQRPAKHCISQRHCCNSCSRTSILEIHDDVVPSLLVERQSHVG